MTFEEWFEDKFKFPYDPEHDSFKNIFNVDKVEGLRIGWHAALESVENNLPDPSCEAQDAYMGKIQELLKQV